MKLFILFLISVFTYSNYSDVKIKKIEEKPSAPFTWSFTENSSILYTFEQDVQMIGSFSERQDLKKSRIRVNSEMFVTATDSTSANVGLRNGITTMTDINSDGIESDTTTEEMTMMLTEGMSNKSEFEDLNSAMLFQPLFPLPMNDLKKGESTSIPMKIPFNAGGSRIFIKGEILLTYEGDKKFHRTDCAVLKGVIDVSKVNIPKEVAKEYTVSLAGEGVYYFDQKGCIFIGGDVATTFEMDIKASDEMAEEFSRNIYMLSESKYSYRFKEITNN